MSMNPNRQSPLLQSILSILRQNSEGLTIPEIRRKLLLLGMLGIQESDIDKIVRSREFKRLPGGRIVIEELASPISVADEVTNVRPDEPFAKYPSTLRDFPELSSYVIFDTETNGLDPSTSDLFQLSAIKVINGKPERAFDRYAHIDTSSLTRALKEKLHFDDLQLEDVLASAPDQITIIEEFKRFCGELPVCAHNGTFDIGFIKKSVPSFSNKLIDTLELFVLAFPTASSHSIENMALLLGYEVDGKKWRKVEEIGLNLGITGNSSGKELFHSAIFDCLMLYFLFDEVIDKLRELPISFKGQINLISSNLGKLLNASKEMPTQPNQITDIIPLRYWSDEVTSITHNTIGTNGFQKADATDLYNDLQRRLNLESRPSQSQMVEEVANAFQFKKKLMIEAPTGTGKTFAYLIPAIQLARSTGQQIVISTSTKTLQDQIVHDLEYRVKPNLPLDFDYSVLKGQENYICIQRLWDAFLEAFWGENEKDTPFEEKLAILYFLRFSSESVTGDMQSVSYWLQQRFPIVVYLKKSLCSQRETCNSSSPCYSFCFHPRAKALAEKTDILIINHSLLLMRHWDDGQPQNLVIDEAHNLEDVATTTYTEEASRELIELWLNKLLRTDGKRGLLVIARRFVNDQELIIQSLGIVRRLRSLVAEFGGYLKEFIEKTGGRFSPKYGCSWRMRVTPHKSHFFAWQYVEQIQKEIFRELDSLQRISFKLSGQLSEYKGSEVYKANSLIKDLQSIQSYLFGLPEEPGQRTLLEEIPLVGFDPLIMVHWIELGLRGQVDSEKIPPEKINWAFKRAPVRVGDLLKAKIYDRVEAMVLTSATLTLAEGGFNFFLDRLGLTDEIALKQLVKLPNVFDYEKHVMLGLPGYFKSTARYDESDAFQSEIARELSCFFQFSEGRGLVLHTARSRMEFVAQTLEKNLTHLPIFWQREGSSTRLLQEEFSKREESILLGLRSFWEGVDVPGPSLSYLIIDKLPFPVPTEPIIEARREQINDSGGNEWSSYLIPLATLHFKQGFGRLMRRSDDHGAVIFLDKRLRGDTFYRESVLGSLPGYRRNDNMIEAEESRPTFYREIAQHMSSIFPDLENRLDLFPCINEELIPDIERLFNELLIPTQICKADYQKWRGNLIRAAKELVGGFSDFKEEQDEAMQSILSGTDTLVVLPTGSGKSITFQLPALLRNGVSLVFSPLIALMRDQVDRLKSKGLSLVDYIVSGQSGAHRDDVYRRMIKGQLRLVYIAPERVRDPALAEAVRNSNVIQVVVDEAHCVHMWGNSFRPDFLNIPNLFVRESRPPMVALTATATKETRAAIVDSLNFKKDFDLVSRTVNRPELIFLVYNLNSAPERIASKQDKMRVLIKILTAARKRDEVALVYTSTVRQAEQISRLLNLNGFSVRHYHGKMQAQAREEVQELFREGIVKIVVCTKAFGMGIDKADVRYVIHYDIPGDLESYFQEAGRAGRDGKPAYCVLLYHKSDLSTQQYFIQSAFPDEIELNSLLQSFRKKSSSGMPILIRPDNLADETGIDVERLDITIHILEKMGYIRRSFNFTLNANILLNRSNQWIVDNLSGDKKIKFERIISSTKISDKVGIQLDLLELAEMCEVDPVNLDLLFTELSSKGWAVYRPWEKGYIIEPQEKLLGIEKVNLGQADIKVLERAMSKNLKRMMRYAESLGAGDCRRRYILEHFGEELNYKIDPCCNLCDPNIAYPWSSVTTGELDELSNEIDPAYLALRVVDWNDSLRSSKNLSPYTQSTLACILTGNSFAATRKIEDPIKKARRLKRLESSPLYGVLQGIRGGEKTLSKIFSRLESGGYIQLDAISFSNSDDAVIEYKAPTLTSLGKQQLQSGKFLGEMN